MSQNGRCSSIEVMMMNTRKKRNDNCYSKLARGRPNDILSHYLSSVYLSIYVCIYVSIYLSSIMKSFCRSSHNLTFLTNGSMEIRVLTYLNKCVVMFKKKGPCHEDLSQKLQQTDKTSKHLLGLALPISHSNFSKRPLWALEKPFNSTLAILSYANHIH
jgi:hypothetical protein